MRTGRRRDFCLVSLNCFFSLWHNAKIRLTRQISNKTTATVNEYKPTVRFITRRSARAEVLPRRLAVLALSIENIQDLLHLCAICKRFGKTKNFPARQNLCARSAFSHETHCTTRNAKTSAASCGPQRRVVEREQSQHSQIDRLKLDGNSQSQTLFRKRR